jgi:mono/diheme cytochrome c family protein
MRWAPSISVAVAVASAALGLSACSEGVEVKDEADRRGAVLFAQRCAGCHTFKAAGAQGSASDVRNKLRNNGPNFDQREVAYDQALYAIRNGGFSGAIMPENIVTGDEMRQVAAFLAKYAGKGAEDAEDKLGAPAPETGGG